MVNCEQFAFIIFLLILKKLMNTRMEQFEKSEMGFAHFDRIKLQRKRMEHVLEVIKDLTFKNNELRKQNILLKQQSEGENLYKKMYEQVVAQKALLVEKNQIMNSELQSLKETALHQEIIINSLKEELYSNQFKGKSNSKLPEDQTCSHKKHHRQTSDNNIIMEEYLILKTQYEDLQNEYSRLYQQFCSKQRQNLDMTDCIQATSKYQGKIEQILNNNYRSKKLSGSGNIDDRLEYFKLREKYVKVKKIKNQLLKEYQIMKDELSGMKIRQQQYESLIQVLKNKRTKICLCHINKFQKQMSQANLIKAEVNRQDSL